MENIPIPILKSIYATIESARSFVRERRKDGVLHCKLRDASETINEIIKLEEKDEYPFWYSLYEGMIGRYVQLKTDFKMVKLENKNLRVEIKELRERYMDLVDRTAKINSSEIDKL